MKKSLLLSFAGVLVASSSMLATNINPGAQTNNLSSIPMPAGETYEYSVVVPFTYTYTVNNIVKGKSVKVTDTVTGNVVGAVYSAPGNTQDFYYQVDNTTSTTTKGLNPGQIQGLQVSDFSGYTTNVNTDMATGKPIASYPATLYADGFMGPNGTVNPTSTSRSGDGSSLSFTFAGLTAGQDSAVFLVETNANSYDALGGFTVSTGKGSAGVSSTFPEPATTPEPGFYGSLAIAISGLILFVRRRSSKAQANSNA